MRKLDKGTSWIKLTRITLPAGIATSTQQRKKADPLLGLLINPLPNGSLHDNTLNPDGAHVTGPES